MIGAADRRLADRDPALPGLSTLLDDAVFAEALAYALPEAGVAAARATYVRYKPATSCLVAYAVTAADGRQVDVYARAHRPEVEEKLESALRASSRSSSLDRGGAVLPDAAVAVHVFPHDRRLPGLRSIVRSTEAVTLRYKPERRWVARAHGPRDTERVVRVQAEPRLHQAVESCRALSAVPGLPVGQCLGSDEATGALWVEWVPGVSLEDLLGRGSAAPAAREAGEALALLHRTPVPGLRVAQTGARSRALAAAATAVGLLVPGAAERARGLARVLWPALSAPGPACTVHGDFSADQVVLAPGGTRLVDLDAVAVDDPVWDLGTFAAELEGRVAAGLLEPSAVEPVVAALLEGYRAARGPAPTEGPRLRAATSAALLLRAAEPFRARVPAWDTALERMLARAGALAPAVAGTRG